MFGSALSAHYVQLITSSGPCDVDTASRLMGKTAPLRADVGPGFAGCMFSTLMLFDAKSQARGDSGT